MHVACVQAVNERQRARARPLTPAVIAVATVDNCRFFVTTTARVRT